MPVSRIFKSLLAGVIALAVPMAQAGTDPFADVESLLPPLMEWSGASESLVAEHDDPWVTPSELSGLTETPSYDETVAWLRKLVAATGLLEMVSIGQSHQGRDIWMVVASADGHFTAKEMSASGKPLLLAQAGIHSGEIDGKDAGLMLLRDMTVAGKRPELLAGANFLFVPIFNVDGHEIISPYNRINQRGPVEMGWRTNARNQNLNRDYAKLDTPGVQAILQVIRQWQPDLYLDLHVTDGADYQYDITFGGNGEGGWSPAIGQWINEAYTPAISSQLEQQGHIPGPLVMAVNGMDMTDGYYVWSGDPRYSNGYGDARHLPTILVENHSLKPYRQRVLGTYVLLAASLDVLGRQGEALRTATGFDRARRPDTIVLGYVASEAVPVKTAFRGIASETYQGKAAGAPVPRWKGEPDNNEVARVMINKPRAVVERPEAYVIPAQWGDIAERLSLHGIPVERIEQAFTVEAEIYALPQAKIAPPAGWVPNPFEGRVRIDPGTPEVNRVKTTFPVGSYRVPTGHDLGELAVLLLEPESPDSFFQWGFFLEIFTRTEYAEAYVLEPLARRMMDSDPGLKAEFEAMLAADEAFAADPQQRLMWFYRQTPYFDPRYLVYPVARVPR